MKIRSLSNKMIEEIEAGPHVVLVGVNPADGFMVYGPFPSWHAAADWLYRVCDDNGWIQQLEAPND